ncbi:MAG: ABC transporter ATP-binding protein [Bacteroidales bacterium]|nr:ABC transporter ATP-binding protein [Bacteroidales bacterium]
MKDFFRLLFRLVPPYKKDVFLNIFNNLVSTIFSLFSFALIIPILEILFQINTGTYPHHEDIWSLPINEIGSALKDNFYCFLLDFIDTHGGGPTLLMLGGFLVGMTFLKTGFMYLASVNMIRIRTSVLRDLRNMIFGKILALPLGFFSEERKGDIIARMSGDVTEVETSIMSSLDMLFKNLIMIVIYFVTMVVLSWEMTLFVLVLLPVAGFLMGRVSKQLKKPSREGQNKWGQILSQIEETLSGLRIVKSFNAENRTYEHFQDENNQLRRITARIFRRQQLAHPMSEFLGTTIIAIVLWFGGTLILSHSTGLSAQVFIYYLVIFYSIINPAKSFSQAWYSIEKGLASMERIDKILLAENNIKDPEHPVELKEFGTGIEYRHVSFKYQSEPVLKDICLKLPKGSTLALVGQSGSGKSTLADLLPRFYDVMEGSITIDGTDIRQVRKQDLRALIGNVSQEPILFNDTFFNNIAFGTKDATMEQVVEAAKIANAHDFIMASENGYQTNIGDRGGKLSGGQRQRISIARAILKNPPILILDEATSALDTESERLVQEALEQLMRNRTTLVIAHRLSTIRHADQICVLHDGRIVECGTHEELLALNGTFRKLYDLQKA